MKFYLLFRPRPYLFIHFYSDAVFWNCHFSYWNVWLIELLWHFLSIYRMRFLSLGSRASLGDVKNQLKEVLLIANKCVFFWNIRMLILTTTPDTVHDSFRFLALADCSNRHLWACSHFITLWVGPCLYRFRSLAMVVNIQELTITGRLFLAGLYSTFWFVRSYKKPFILKRP